MHNSTHRPQLLATRQRAGAWSLTRRQQVALTDNLSRFDSQARWPATNENPGHRRGWLHRHACVAAAAGAGRSSGRPGQPQRLLQPGAQAGPTGEAVACRELSLRQDGRGGPRWHGVAVRRGEVRPRGASGGPGRRALLARESARLHRQQRRRLHEHSRRLPTRRRAAPGVRIELERLRRQHEDAVLRARQHRPSGQHVRGHQEGQRVDGAHLQPSVRAAHDRPALLYRLWPVGPAGHGALPVYQGDPRGSSDRRVQPRPDGARFHLHRRHRRRRRARSRPPGGGRPGVRFGSSRTRREATRRTACSTSATAIPSG